MQAKLILLILFTLIAGVSSAQSSKRKKKAVNVEQQPNSVDPNNPPVENQEKKTSGSSSGKTTYNAERNYYEHMSDLEKERRKNERMMDKPQYSDPLYFGHKRPPKKHKPSRMKYCKVCGIRH